MSGLVRDDHHKVTSYFGERDRVDGRLLADELADIYARHQVRTSIVLRAREGFGEKHHLESEALEVLSLDLPLVSIATDTAERIAAVRDDILDVQPAGMVTVERARLLSGELVRAHFSHELPRPALSVQIGEQVKLTAYVGRKEKTTDGRPAFRGVIDDLHRAGVSGATALLGIDGTVHGNRHRAGFFSANRCVPIMIVAVGDSDPISRGAGRLRHILREPLVGVERVRICKRDGRQIARPPRLEHTDHDGLQVWQKLTVYGSMGQRHDGRPLHEEIVRRARDAGAGGATTLQGVWGYHGDHQPQGDRFFQIQRRVPLVTTVIDRPDKIPAIFDVIDELTGEVGLVTSELVPARHVRTDEGWPERLDLAAAQ